MKVNLDLIESVLRQKQVPEPKIQEIVTVLTEAANEEKEDNKADRQPKTKNTFVLVCLAPNEAIRKAVSEAALYITQIKESETHTSVLEKLRKAAGEYNQTRKGQKSPLKSFSDIFSFCKRKFFKENGLLVKSQEPVIVVTTENKF